LRIRTPDGVRLHLTLVSGVGWPISDERLLSDNARRRGGRENGNQDKGSSAHRRQKEGVVSRMDKEHFTRSR
jgi:hypothetical protein